MESWIKLSHLKESHSIKTAKFVMSRGIDNEPTFAWWVPCMLRRISMILVAIKTCIRKTMHKWGIEIPRDVAHAMEIDRNHRNTLWRDALALEMHNVGVAFKILDEGECAPEGWSNVPGHLIWDMKSHQGSLDSQWR